MPAAATRGARLDDAGEPDDAVDVAGLGPQPPGERRADEPADERAGPARDGEPVDDRRRTAAACRARRRRERRARDPVVGREARAVVQRDAVHRDAEAGEHRRDRARARRGRARSARVPRPSSRVSSSAVSLLLTVSICSTICVERRRRDARDLARARGRGVGPGSVGAARDLHAARREQRRELLHGVERRVRRRRCPSSPRPPFDDQRAERADVAFGDVRSASSRARRASRS